MLEGLILVGDDLDPLEGQLAIESGRIKEITERRGCREQIIMPGLVNSHTHIGDSIFKDQGIHLPLGELVGSPDGLKHRLLGEASDRQLVTGMRAAEDEMIGGGITTFIDFREQGLRGIRLFRRAVRSIRGLALGRPSMAGDLSGEIHSLVGASDGIGLDRVGCYEDRQLESVREMASGKRIGVHVMEARRTPGELERALDVLGADILVHLTQAEREDLRLVADRGASVAICPRSNMSLGLGTPPLDAMLEQGLNVGLGSDNCMISSPNIFREMELALMVSRRREPREILRMATISGAGLARLGDETGSIDTGKAADLTVLKVGGGLRHVREIHAGIVKRAGPEDVSMVLLKGRPLLDRREVGLGQ